jgi:hypothetical protein
LKAESGNLKSAIRNPHPGLFVCSFALHLLSGVKTLVWVGGEAWGVEREKCNFCIEKSVYRLVVGVADGQVQERHRHAFDRSPDIASHHPPWGFVHEGALGGAEG